MILNMKIPNALLGPMYASATFTSQVTMNTVKKSGRRVNTPVRKNLTKADMNARIRFS
jgi:hypothetical protein